MGKSTFFTGQPVFSQLLSLIPRTLVSELARKHGSDRYVKSFTAYDHLVSMLYAGFFQCTSIREVITGLQANAGRLSHLGFKKTPRRSTLSDANKRRDVIFFEDLYHALYAKYFGLPDSRWHKKNKKEVFIIDSTTFSLFTSVMKGAGTSKADGRRKGGAKAHLMINSRHDIPAYIYVSEGKEQDLTFLQKVFVPDNATVIFDMGYINYSRFKEWGSRGITWVTRLKKDAYVDEKLELPPDEKSSLQGVVSDKLVVLGRPSNKNKTPLIKARIVAYHDNEKKRDFKFVTNELISDPLQIAALYKRRWQIEILFKRIKQRYPLKYFLGDNPNAIKIQIWCALLCDLLVRIIQCQVNKIKTRPWAYATISAMIKHHLMTYINLKDFLINPERALLRKTIVTQQLELFERGAYF